MKQPPLTDTLIMVSFLLLSFLSILFLFWQLLRPQVPNPALFFLGCGDLASRRQLGKAEDIRHRASTREKNEVTLTREFFLYSMQSTRRAGQECNQPTIRQHHPGCSFSLARHGLIGRGDRRGGDEGCWPIGGGKPSHEDEIEKKRGRRKKKEPRIGARQGEEQTAWVFSLLTQRQPASH